MYNYSVQARAAGTTDRPKPRTNIVSSVYNHRVGLRTRSQSLPFRSLPQKEDSDFTPLLSGVYRNLCAAVQYAASNVATWVGPAGSEYLDASVGDILRPIRCRSVTIIRPFIVDFTDDVVRGVLQTVVCSFNEISSSSCADSEDTCCGSCKPNYDLSGQSAARTNSANDLSYVALPM